jgi:hypothetical protein
MLRTKVKGTGARKASSPETEPDFYSMPFVQDNNPVASPVATKPVPPEAVSPQMSVRQQVSLPERAHATPVSPSPAFSAKPRVPDSLSKSAILGVSVAAAPYSLANHLAAAPVFPNLEPPAADSSQAYRVILTQLMETSNRLNTLREANRVSFTFSSENDGAPSASLDLLAVAAANTQQRQNGPLHLNAMGMACDCAIPAF